MNNTRKRIFQKHYKSSKPKDDEEIARLKQKYENINEVIIKSFTDLPLSWKTQKGLKGSNYKIPTQIQKESIGYSLQGKDVMGAAITGSGKTLAFLIPVLECLFMEKWSRHSGVGAIIISPTRELAYQIFQTLKKIGIHHDISAGLIIGGKNLKFERSRMDQCNIIICTPGRILQHMDQNPLFNITSMKILVLDEADRCLDMGFKKTMNAILANLPLDRQTMLFSATQTKSVEDLARLSLKEPVYVAPHEHQLTVPVNLQQSYVVVNLEDKLTMIWSFIKNHLKQKVIVFLASCKQVKYFYEVFKKLRPGTSILALYGTLHQEKRVNIYDEFCRKSNVVLFATDIASRGLDFPNVNWVIQLDCPEDANQYIHRAGRTARHDAKGESLLILLPSEEFGMIKELEKKDIIIDRIHIDQSKMFSPKAKIDAFLAQDQQLKDTAKRAFISYIKSVFLMKNKNVFKTNEIDFEVFSKSLGLVSVPRIRIIDKLKHMNKNMENQSLKIENNVLIKQSNVWSESFDQSSNGESLKKNHLNNVDSPAMDFDLSSNSENEEDLIKIKRENHEIEHMENISEIQNNANSKHRIATKAATARRVLKKKIVVNKRVFFNEEGHVKTNQRELQSDIGKEYMYENSNDINIEMAKKVLQEEDKFDRKRHQELIKCRKHQVKSKRKGVDDNHFENDIDVDLSWLPDPDTIYDKPVNVSKQSLKNYNFNGDVQTHLPDSELFVENMKRKHSDSDISFNGVKQIKKIKPLTLDEAEHIAMKLFK